MTRARHPAPWWFTVAVAVAIAVGARAFDVDLSGPRDPATGEPVQMAFWGFVVVIAQAIWTGVQVAGQVTLAFLSWSVNALWAFGTTVFNGLREVGSLFVRFGRWSYDFLKLTFDNVIKPAWKFFWRWFDKARKWLDNFVRPAFKFLAWVKANILDFYDKYVRPILDVIGIGRRVLQLLGSFGLDWAKALDKRLADLEEQINRPFQIVLAKLNEVVNLVNRVVTINGLIQRIAHIRTIERDMRDVQRRFVAWRSTPLTAADYDAARRRAAARSINDAVVDARQLFVDDSGRYQSRVDEWVGNARKHF